VIGIFLAMTAHAPSITSNTRNHHTGAPHHDFIIPPEARPDVCYSPIFFDHIEASGTLFSNTEFSVDLDRLTCAVIIRQTGVSTVQ